jgi:hypothetical protein
MKSMGDVSHNHILASARVAKEAETVSSDEATAIRPAHDQLKEHFDSSNPLKNTEVIDIVALAPKLHRRQVNLNLMSIGLLRDEGRESGSFGSEVESRLATHYGVNVLGDQFKGAKELSNLVFTCPPEEFPKKFDAWLADTLQGITFVKPEEIKKAALILAQAGFYIPKSYFRNSSDGKYSNTGSFNEVVSERNGFVDPQLWTLYVAKGKIPAGDPHDLCSHAAGFIEPVFREEMKKSGKINFFVSTLHRTLSEEYGPDNKNFLGIHEIGDQLRILTDHTFENMSYLTKSNPARLVLQGNGGFNFASAVSRAYPRLEAGSGKVNMEDILERIISRRGHFNLDTLKNVKQFEEQHPQIVARFYRAQAKMSVDTQERHSQVISRFNKIYDENFSQHLNKPDQISFSTGLIDNLATAISKDEELSLMFDYDNRIELYKVGNDYFDAYLKYFCSEHGMDHVLARLKHDFERLDFSNLEESLAPAIENRKKHVDRLSAERLENQKKNEQEIKLAVDKFLVENPDFVLKRDIYNKYPEQIDSNFCKVRHLGFQGMEQPPGLKSSLGLLVKVEFEGKGVLQEFMGRIFREYQAGFSLIDESRAAIHEVNTNYGEIISAYVLPEQDISWEHVYANWSDSNRIFDTLKKYNEPYAIFISDNDAQVYGRIAALKLESGKEIICIADSAGHIHTVDPSYSKYGVVLQLTEGNKFTRNLFLGLGSAKTIQMFEKPGDPELNRL